MTENFLTRWSRRKQEARGSETAAARLEPARDAGPPPEPVLTAEEIARLPGIEELTAETDITVFLRRGVPAPLRNAALRRMWLLDPAIRDFAGHARDYDYDWNMPGGAPGHGPLEPGDDVGSMVRSVFGERAADTAERHPSKQVAHQETAQQPECPRTDPESERTQPGRKPGR